MQKPTRILTAAVLAVAMTGAGAVGADAKSAAEECASHPTMSFEVVSKIEFGALSVLGDTLTSGDITVKVVDVKDATTLLDGSVVGEATVVEWTYTGDAAANGGVDYLVSKAGKYVYPTYEDLESESYTTQNDQTSGVVDVRHLTNKALSHITFCGDMQVNQPQQPCESTVVAPEDMANILKTSYSLTDNGSQAIADVTLPADSGLCEVEVHLSSFLVHQDTLAIDQSQYFWEGQTMFQDVSVTLTNLNPTAQLIVNLPSCNWQIDLYVWDADWMLGSKHWISVDGFEWLDWDAMFVPPHHGRLVMLEDGTILSGQDIWIGYDWDLSLGACAATV